MPATYNRAVSTCQQCTRWAVTTCQQRTTEQCPHASNGRTAERSAYGLKGLKGFWGGGGDVQDLQGQKMSLHQGLARLQSVKAKVICKLFDAHTSPGDVLIREDHDPCGSPRGTEMHIAANTTTCYPPVEDHDMHSVESDGAHGEAPSEHGEPPSESHERKAVPGPAVLQVTTPTTATPHESTEHASPSLDVQAVDREDADQQPLAPACHPISAETSMTSSDDPGSRDGNGEKGEQRERPHNQAQAPGVLTDVNAGADTDRSRQDAGHILLNSEILQCGPVCTRKDTGPEGTPRATARDPRAWRQVVHVEQQKAHMLALQLDAACTELKVLCNNAACSKELLLELREEMKQQARADAGARVSSPPLNLDEQVDILLSLADLQTRFTIPAKRTFRIPSGLQSPWEKRDGQGSSAPRDRPECDPQPAYIVSAAIAQKMQYVELAESLYKQNAGLLQRVIALERKKRTA
eukprot:jgi/Botrbrau1/13869/Bobra.0056s0101.1